MLALGLVSKLSGGRVAQASDAARQSGVRHRQEQAIAGMALVALATKGDVIARNKAP